MKEIQGNQQILCRNKEKVELKLEVKNVATFHNFVATQNERD